MTTAVEVPEIRVRGRRRAIQPVIPKESVNQKPVVDTPKKRKRVGRSGHDADGVKPGTADPQLSSEARFIMPQIAAVDVLLPDPDPVIGGRQSPSAASVTEICDLLAEKHREREAAIGSKNKLLLPVIARVRRFMGWRHDLPEKERKKLNKAACALTETLFDAARAFRKQHKLETPFWATKDIPRIEAQVVLLANPAPEHEVAARANVGFILPNDDAIRALQARADDVYALMQKLAKQLPVWEFAKTIPNLGPGGLAKIIGIAGDLNRFGGGRDGRNGLRKYMSMIQWDGKAPSLWRKKGGLSAEQWIKVGYDPKRRSLMYVIGELVLRKPGPYRDLYLRRKDYEKARDPEIKKFIADLRARRVMEQKLLGDLRREWRILTPA